MFLKTKFNLKYVVLSHGHDVPWVFPKQMFFYHLLSYFMIKRASVESQANFMLTDGLKNNIDKFLGVAYSQKNVVIPNGTDFNYFKPDYSKREKTFKILFVGQLVEQKDPLTFLKAIRLYSEKNKKFVVAIAGDGILRNKMEQYIEENNMADRVRVLGWLSKDELRSEYQSSHVVVVSSVFEAMSVSVLEALASGCFLISTPLEGASDGIVENINGVYVDYRSPTEIASRLDEYYRNRFLSEYVVDNSVINELKGKFSWDTLVQQYDTHLKAHLNK